MSYPRGFGIERDEPGWPGRTDAGLLDFEDPRGQDFVSRQQAWTPARDTSIIPPMLRPDPEPRPEIGRVLMTAVLVAALCGGAVGAVGTRLMDNRLAAASESFTGTPTGSSEDLSS